MAPSGTIADRVVLLTESTTLGVPPPFRSRSPGRESLFMTDSPGATPRLDTTALEQKVKAMYRDVALDPHGEFHFEMGRVLA